MIPLSEQGDNVIFVYVAILIHVIIIVSITGSLESTIIIRMRSERERADFIMQLFIL